MSDFYTRPLSSKQAYSRLLQTAADLILESFGPLKASAERVDDIRLQELTGAYMNTLPSHHRFEFLTEIGDLPSVVSAGLLGNDQSDRFEAGDALWKQAVEYHKKSILADLDREIELQKHWRGFTSESEFEMNIRIDRRERARDLRL